MKKFRIMEIIFIKTIDNRSFECYNITHKTSKRGFHPMFNFSALYILGLLSIILQLIMLRNSAESRVRLQKC